MAAGGETPTAEQIAEEAYNTEALTMEAEDFLDYEDVRPSLARSLELMTTARDLMQRLMDHHLFRLNHDSEEYKPTIRKKLLDTRRKVSKLAAKLDGLISELEERQQAVTAVQTAAADKLHTKQREAIEANLQDAYHHAEGHAALPEVDMAMGMQTATSPAATNIATSARPDEACTLGAEELGNTSVHALRGELRECVKGHTAPPVIMYKQTSESGRQFVPSQNEPDCPGDGRARPLQKEAARRQQPVARRRRRWKFRQVHRTKTSRLMHIVKGRLQLTALKKKSVRVLAWVRKPTGPCRRVILGSQLPIEEPSGADVPISARPATPTEENCTEVGATVKFQKGAVESTLRSCLLDQSCTHPLTTLKRVDQFSLFTLTHGVGGSA
jgi:hypothetical protein